MVDKSELCPEDKNVKIRYGVRISLGTSSIFIWKLSSVSVNNVTFYNIKPSCENYDKIENFLDMDCVFDDRQFVCDRGVVSSYHDNYHNSVIIQENNFVFRWIQ